MTALAAPPSVAATPVRSIRSWNGTIFILAAFTIFGVTQSIVALVRMRTGRRWAVTVARLVGGLRRSTMDAKRSG